MITCRLNPLFSRYSTLFGLSVLTVQNSGIAGIAAMRFHKGTFSELIYITDFIAFSPILSIFTDTVAIPAIPLFGLKKKTVRGGLK